jgi:hypothetical protein
MYTLEPLLRWLMIYVGRLLLINLLALDQPAVRVTEYTK